MMPYLHIQLQSPGLMGVSSLDAMLFALGKVQYRTRQPAETQRCLTGRRSLDLGKLAPVAASMPRLPVPRDVATSHPCDLDT